MKDELRILVVDDLELVHAPIEKFLKDFVFIKTQLIIISSYNLTQAKRYLLEGKYDIVMLDGDVGEGWGYEIIPNIIEHNAEVLIISCSNDDHFNTKSIKMGSHGEVNKKYLYDWNDKEGEYRTQKANEINGLLVKILSKD